MTVEIKVPAIGESINEATLSKWLKNDGDTVQQDEVICELESEKATFELPAEKAGQLKIIAPEKSVVKVGEVIGSLDTSVEVSTDKKETAPKQEKKKEQKTETVIPEKVKEEVTVKESYAKNVPSPAAEKMIKESGAKVANGTGKDGRIIKADVLNSMKDSTTEKISQPSKAFSREERRKKMSSLRKTLSKHLVAAKNTTAMLTTFNEVDMKPIMDIRTKNKEVFKERFGVNLGFMSFFAKAVCYALREWPALNAFIDGDEIIYHDYCDISIAVSTPKGLVVPVIRNAESLSFAEVEAKVADLAKRGRENKLFLEEMSGGTFTITNGGVFGSLMSTPIINVPQSAILGMHKIQDRPVVIDGQMVVRPMMYVAVSYDHRIIDGRESVSFLVRIKELLEHPDHLLMGDDPVQAMLGL